MASLADHTPVIAAWQSLKRCVKSISGEKSRYHSLTQTAILNESNRLVTTTITFPLSA
jgi:hypothetical protein